MVDKYVKVSMSFNAPGMYCYYAQPGINLIAIYGDEQQP